MNWWVSDYLQHGQHVLLAAQVFWVIASICLHELAHGWAAIWQGDDTPRRLGHMTLNPLVHMGPMSLIMFGVVGIAWGMMPTDPSRYRWRRKGNIVVAGAGPAMNLLLAFIALTIAAVWLRLADPSNSPAYENVYRFMWFGGMINIVLAAINLIPVPPLDGSRIVGGLSFRMWRLYQHHNAPTAGLFIFAILIMGFGDVFYALAGVVANGYLAALSALLG